MASQSQPQSQSSLFFSVSDKSSSSGRRPQDRRKATARKVFCSFCKEEGHMVNDRYGKTVCPKLLATECRYCHQKGHILSHCPLLKDKNSRRVAPEQQQEQEQKQTSNSRASPTARFSPAFLRVAASEMQSTKTPAPGNSPPRRPLKTRSRFAALVDDSDSDSENEDEPAQPTSTTVPRISISPKKVIGAWMNGRPTQRKVFPKVSTKVIPVTSEQIPVKQAPPSPPASPTKKKVSFNIEDDFAHDEPTPSAPVAPAAPSPAVAPAAPSTLNAVDFSSFLGDVADAWADEEEKDSTDSEEVTEDIADVW